MQKLNQSLSHSADLQMSAANAIATLSATTSDAAVAQEDAVAASRQRFLDILDKTYEVNMSWADYVHIAARVPDQAKDLKPYIIYLDDIRVPKGRIMMVIDPRKPESHVESRFSFFCSLPRDGSVMIKAAVHTIEGLDFSDQLFTGELSLTGQQTFKTKSVQLLPLTKYPELMFPLSGLGMVRFTDLDGKDSALVDVNPLADLVRAGVLIDPHIFRSSVIAHGNGLSLVGASSILLDDTYQPLPEFDALFLSQPR